MKAYAYDAAGNYASTSLTVNVANSAPAPTPATPADTTAPVPKISSPAANSRLTGNNVSVKATATDNVGVKSMSLFVDGTLQTTATGGNLSYGWTIKKAAVGYHTLTVEAVDAAGNVARHSIQVVK